MTRKEAKHRANTLGKVYKIVELTNELKVQLGNGDYTEVSELKVKIKQLEDELVNMTRRV